MKSRTNGAGSGERPTSNRVLRARAFLHDHRQYAVVLLALAALLGGYVTYTTAVAPGTTTETRELSRWESTGQFTHRATVVEGSAAFRRGAVLRNRSVYFQQAAPTLNGSFVYEYDASDGGSPTVTVSTVVVLRSVSGAGESDPTEYWRTERSIGRDQIQSLSPGERITVPFSVNVSAAAERARRIERQIGAGPGETELFVASRVRLSGPVNGEDVAETTRYRLPIELDASVYRVTDPGRVTESDSATERVTVARSYGPGRRLGGPALLLTGVGGLAGLWIARRRDSLSVTAAERERLETDRAREEFDDWITVGWIPAVVRASPPVEVDSLAGLVDVAIDTDQRVVENVERDEFVVLGETVTYVYRPPHASDRAADPGRHGSTILATDSLSDGADGPTGDSDTNTAQ